MILQKPLIRYILDPLARLTDRLSPKLKDILFVLSLLGIILQYFGRGSGFWNYRYLIFFGVDCVFLGIMLLCVLKPGMQPVKFRLLPMLCWYGVGFMLLQSGLRLNVDYLPEAVLFFVGYPIVFLVWNNSDHVHIFRLILRSMEIAFVIYLVISFLFFPMTDVRYGGLFNNLNGTAGYLAIAAVCLLFDCLMTKKFSVMLVLRTLLLGICVSLLFYTSSRTGLMEIVLVAIVAAVFQLIRLWKEKKLFFLRNVLFVALSVVMMFQCTIMALQYVRPVAWNLRSGLEQFLAEKLSDEFFDPDAIHLPPIDIPDDEVIHAGESWETTNARLAMDNRSFEQITTGRSTIWIRYAERLNLLGHKDSGGFSFHYVDHEMVIGSAHMTILQLAYENGLPAGIFYLGFNLIAGVFSVIYALRNKKDPMALLPLMITVAYGVHSLLASTAVSFWYMSTFLYYLVQAPVLVKKTPEKLPEEI